VLSNDDAIIAAWEPTARLGEGVLPQGGPHAADWDAAKEGGVALVITHKGVVGSLAWHHKGDYIRCPPSPHRSCACRGVPRTDIKLTRALQPTGSPSDSSAR
jgi:hypothetical protein